MRFRFSLFGKKKKSVHRTNAEDKKLILREDTPFAVKEAYRTTYTNLLYLPITDRCKKIAVTKTAKSKCENSTEKFIFFIGTTSSFLLSVPNNPLFPPAAGSSS